MENTSNFNYSANHFAWPREILEEFLIDHLGDEYTETSTGEHWRYDSIFTDDGKKKLYINLDKDGIYMCFKTSESGDFVKLVSEILGVSKAEAKDFLFEKYIKGVDLDKFIKKERDDTELDPILKASGYLNAISLPPKCYKITDSPSAMRYYNYLKNRHIPEHIIKQWYYCMHSDADYIKDYYDRIIIPVMNDGKLVFYTGRDVNPNSSLRYKEPSVKDANKKSEVVYNIDTKEKTVVIVEGVIDAVRLGDNGLALFGKNLSDTQCAMINSRGFEKIIVAFDNDDDFDKAPKQVIKTFEKLQKRGLNVFMFDWPAFVEKYNLKNVKDFGDIPMERIDVRLFDEFLMTDVFVAEMKFLTK